jgi:hypothetical protein
MRFEYVVLSLFPAVLATPIPRSTSQTCEYGNWATWQTWQPTWLQTVAPQIKASSNDASNPVSPYACTNCTQSALIALFAEKWQPFLDLVLSNVNTQLSTLASTNTSLPAITIALKTQLAGDLITSIQKSLYEPSIPIPSHSALVKRHGNSTGHPLSAPYKNYTYQGCMTNFASKALVQSMDTNFGNLTNEKCVDFCAEQGYAIAGTQSGSQCFCGNDITEQTLFIEERACATSCDGDDTEVCGDNQKLSLYATFNVTGGVFDRAAVRTNWTEVGCVAEGTNHTLTGAAYSCLGMTVEMCMNFCDVMGFPVAGLEYGGECYCGNSFENGGGGCTGGCSTPCIGDETQMCGGTWKLNVYERVNVKTPVTACGVNGVSGGCALGNCSEYNFTSAWSGDSIHWDGIALPNNTDVCASPCEVVTYYPYFIWQMHENIRLKIADRLAVDWPERIADLIGEDCSCEIKDIEVTIRDCGNVSYGLDGTAESWLCEVISTAEKL